MLNRKLLQRLVTAVAVLILATGSALASSFNFPYKGTLGEARLDAGRYDITWQNHSPEVTVTVNKGKNVIATAKGRLENRETKYERNMVVYTTQPDGSQSISELRIGGTRSAIVFDK